MSNVYIIAEIGINFNGSLVNCYKMIDSAVDAGCSAGKFQLFSAKNLYPKSAGKLDWKDADKEYSYDIYEAVKKFELPEEWIDKLINYCEEKKIDFMSSIFSIQDLELSLNKGMKKIKLSSYSITNIPLIEATAKTGLPTIMSTGGATLSETEEAINAFLKYSTEDKLTILHCSIQYPTDLKDVNMGVLDTFKYAFPNIKYGYSDHTFEVSDAPVQATYLGANVIEKHITLDKKMEGPDHFFALEPHELKQMVGDIKKAKEDLQNGNIKIDTKIYGSSAKICHPHEQYLRDFAYSSLFTKRPIKKGEVIKPEDLSILRPGKKQRGLDPKYLKLFEEKKIVANRDIACEDPVKLDLLTFDSDLNQYDKWNIVKQKIERKDKEIKFRQGNIYFMSVGQNIGYEVYGKKDLFLRPVLVYRKLSHSSFVGIPLTSKQKEGNYYFTFRYTKNFLSTALLNQMRVFDIKRSEYYDGYINTKDFSKLRDKVKEFMDITPKPKSKGNVHASKKKLQKDKSILAEKPNNVK